MRVAIVHPWFPQYRKAFFDELIRKGAQEGITVHIFHGSPPPEWAERGDSVTEDYAVPLPTRFIKIGGRSLVLKSPVPLWKRGPYDLIVLEQAVRNMESYALLLRSQRAKVAFWGHGRTYTESVGKVQEKIKLWLTKRGTWFFAYTDGGVNSVVSAGFPADRVTMVQNSVDTTGLSAAISRVDNDMRDTFCNQHNLRGKTGLFIGGLDSSKRLDFLLSSAELAHAADPEFRLLVAGSGSGAELIEAAAASRSWISYLGRLSGHEKAMALASCQVILMPGRVGLVAVDSFASGRPIITTRWRWHAPEFEYLTAGHDAVITSDDAKSFAEAIVATLNDHEDLTRLQENALDSASKYTVAHMAENFLDGLSKLANDGRK